MGEESSSGLVFVPARKTLVRQRGKKETKQDIAEAQRRAKLEVAWANNEGPTTREKVADRRPCISPVMRFALHGVLGKGKRQRGG